MTYVGERTLPGAILNASADAPWMGAGQSAAGASLTQAGDGITPLLAGAAGTSQDFASPLQGLLAQIIGLLQRFLGGAGGGEPQAPGEGARYFENATAASTGDPHLSFNGEHFDDMRSHPDLLASRSFEGGYRLSTQVTQPAANGITYNQEASVTTNFGQTSVSLDNSGIATLVRDGQSTQIADGATYNLGDGESVHRNGDGTLVITDRNGYGGSIQTTMSQNGNGIDVNVTGHDVSLGGYLVNRT